MTSKIAPTPEVSGRASLDPSGKPFRRSATDKIDRDPVSPGQGKLPLSPCSAASAPVPEANNVVGILCDQTGVDINHPTKEGRPIPSATVSSGEPCSGVLHASHKRIGAFDRIDDTVTKLITKPYSHGMPPIGSPPVGILHAAGKIDGHSIPCRLHREMLPYERPER
jgi:hypothetical protein